MLNLNTITKTLGLGITPKKETIPIADKKCSYCKQIKNRLQFNLTIKD